MEYGFQYLIYKYTLAGAREKFKDICTELMRRIYGTGAQAIRVSQGNGGIDVMVGDLSAPIVAYQCKFFHGRIGNAQKNQIRESFRRALENQSFTMSKWILCLPIDLHGRERKWWDMWARDQQRKAGIPIELWDGSYLLELLRHHGLYEEVFGIEETERPELLTNWMVDSAKTACLPKNIWDYRMVDQSFETMLRVIAADRDVPHTKALDAVDQAIREGRNVILGGNSGMGKTSLMLRYAVEWVRGGNVALWLSLPDREDLTEAQAGDIYRRLLDTLGPGQQALLCLDDPFENQDALARLRGKFPEDPRIRVLLAECSNRLTQMAAPDANQFHGWFDGAVVVTLEGLYERTALRIGDCEHVACLETRTRREQILGQCLRDLEQRGTIPRGSSFDIQREVLRKYGNITNVTLVELIYRGLFYAKKKATVADDIVLDWEEWTRFIRRNLGKTVSAVRLYGVIAACSVFDVPMTLRCFCGIFGLEERDLHEALRSLQGTGNMEPVLYREQTRTIRPKHGVIAELFFLFNNETPGEVMELVLESMNEPEIEEFLKQIIAVEKRGFQSDRLGRFDRIGYYELLNLILHREEIGEIHLSAESRAMALLGLLWCVPLKDRSSRVSEVLALLEKAAPPMTESRISSTLYTEWGRLLANNRKNKAAEEKFRRVAEQFPEQLHARMELGRLLSKQRGREAEAEQCLKEAIRIDPVNLQSRTELGHLLAMQRGREAEAERHLKEAIRIDPKSQYPRTELGRLLSKQPDRAAEAEQFLRESIQINPMNLHPRTELGRLLSKQPGREAEAEQYLKEAIQIGPMNPHPRTELGRLLSKQPGREDEAEQILKEAIRIDARDIQALTMLGRILIRQPDRKEEAERYLKEVIRIDPANQYAHALLLGLPLDGQKHKKDTNDTPVQFPEDSVQDQGGDGSQKAELHELLPDVEESELDEELNEIKVVFLGDGGAGKSLTIERLLHNGEKPESFDGDSTPGIAIHKLDDLIVGQNIRIRFWDFGGQEILHSMHRMFLTSRTLYVIILSAREDMQDERAKYWLHNLKSAVTGAPVILVINQIDQNERASINEKALSEMYPELKSVVKMSALKDSAEDFNRKLTDVLRSTVNEMETPHSLLPRVWNRIKLRLEHSDKDLIHRGYFEEICREEHMVDNRETREKLLRLFNDLGVCFCCDEDTMDDYMILRPEWITNAIYTLIFNPNIHMRNGLVPHKAIYSMLKSTAKEDNTKRSVLKGIGYKESDVDYVLKVIRKFELSYTLRDDHEFFPMLCDKDTRPILNDYANDPDTYEMRCVYDYLPQNVIHKLMIRLQNELDQSNVWRTGVRFRSKSTNCSSVVCIDEHDLRIIVRPEEKDASIKQYMNYLIDEVDRINQSLNVEVKERQVAYKIDNIVQMFDYDMLKEGVEKGQKRVFSKNHGCMIDVNDILNPRVGTLDTERAALMDTLIKACENLQANKNYWPFDENGLNSYIREILRAKGYIVHDQTLTGIGDSESESTKPRDGELDLDIRKVHDRRWTIFEGLWIKDSAQKSKWDKHLKKLLSNYNPVGLPFLIQVSYIECEREKFEAIHDKLIEHLENHAPEQYQLVKAIPLPVAAAEQEPNQFLFGSQCRYKLIGSSAVPTTIYHLFVRLGK